MIPVEEIPSTCRLLYRIHKQHFRNNRIIPGAFRELGEGENKSMSTDWGKYSTPQESRNRARIPNDNGIVSFNVGNVRNIPLDVIHNPDFKLKNPAHTDVKGLYNPKVKDKARLELMDIYEWVIHIS